MFTDRNHTGCPRIGETQRTLLRNKGCVLSYVEKIPQ